MVINKKNENRYGRQNLAKRKLYHDLSSGKQRDAELIEGSKLRIILDTGSPIINGLAMNVADRI